MMTQRRRTLATSGLLNCGAAVRRILGLQEGSQLLEFALAAPFLIVVVIGVIDFSSVYSLKQKVNNAAREGARYAANQYSDPADVTTTSVGAVGTVVSNYLTNAGVTKCAIGSASGGPTDYTFGSSSSGCGSFELEVNRAVPITLNGTAYLATKVTITYPVTWSIGTIMKLFLPSSTLSSALPSTVVTDATIQNID
jgi:Flp pilus assembly protein TadG